MARRSLGDRLEALSEADQGEFPRLFTNLIVASYMGKIELYAGEIRYLGERVDGAEAAVQSQIVTPKGSQVNHLLQHTSFADLLKTLRQKAGSWPPRPLRA
jgi:ABC-type transporter MlaC component